MEVLTITNKCMDQLSLATGETIDAGNSITICIEAGASNTISGGTCNIAHLLVTSPYTMDEAGDESQVVGEIGGTPVLINGNPLAVGAIQEGVTSPITVQA